MRASVGAEIEVFLATFGNLQPEVTTLTMIERITTAMADLDSIDSL